MQDHPDDCECADCIRERKLWAKIELDEYRKGVRQWKESERRKPWSCTWSWQMVPKWPERINGMKHYREYNKRGQLGDFMTSILRDWKTNWKSQECPSCTPEKICLYHYQSILFRAEVLPRQKALALPFLYIWNTFRRFASTSWSILILAAGYLLMHILIWAMDRFTFR